MKNKWIIVISMFLFRGIAIAQLNESDTLKFQMRTSISGSWQKGNVDFLIVRGKFDLVANGDKKFVFKSQNNSLYQQFGDFKADNDINSRNYLYHHPQQKIYPFAMFFAQTNFRRKINYRLFGGVGLTGQAIRNKYNSLKFSASVVYESTQFSTNQFNQTLYNGRNNISLWRGTFYISGVHKILRNKLNFYYNTYWQPAFGSISNNRVNAETGAEMTIWKGLSFYTQYTYSYEQVVAFKIKQTDRILTFGLSYQYKN